MEAAMIKRTVIAVIIFSFLVAIAAPAYCDDPLKKLGRGICNVATCPLELLKQPSDVSNADGPMAGLTYGILKGAAMVGVRALVGVYEIATFPIPVPQDYKPILTNPEFFLEEQNW